NTVIAPQSTEQDADLVLSGIALTGLAPNGLNRLLSCSAGSPRALIAVFKVLLLVLFLQNTKRVSEQTIMLSRIFESYS
ncbi:hypothetical protein, partial [Pseudovibrio ascidiaceicola]|uniref:hypothetical protein n=1 Tax=Pseudovibrio ascidiaceicola TaxID=285279 RepID=UPI001AD8DA08